METLFFEDYYEVLFQSPQWGDNSKALEDDRAEFQIGKFQSPQWGDNSKVLVYSGNSKIRSEFQSPQWGDNSKVK